MQLELEIHLVCAHWAGLQLNNVMFYYSFLDVIASDSPPVTQLT